MAACEAEQTKQAKALLLADANGCITRADVNMGEFGRPINLEILKIGSSKFLSVAAVQNATFIVSCGFPLET